MKKTIITLLLTIFSFFGYSQNNEFKLFKKINGIEIFYKLTKTKSNEKNDYWSIEFEYVNNTSSDIYYKTITKQVNTLVQKSSREVNYFCTIELENKKTIDFYSDLLVEISGDKTRLCTDKSEKIYVFKKQKTYTKQMSFKGNIGVVPVLTTNVVNDIIFTNNIYDFL